MNGSQFDGLVKSFWAERDRRGFMRGGLMLAAGLWAVHRTPNVAGAQEFWPCPDGVDGHRRDCMCECRRFTDGISARACQAACLECNGHVSAVCWDITEEGALSDLPVCCADGKPCSFVCGDCPDCEPWPDLI
jgi:hypothetical protein